MRKLILLFVSCLILLSTFGCSTTTITTDEKGNTKKEFTVSETAIVDNTKIKINSVKRLDKECSWEYEGKCQSYSEPENDFFIIIDLTLENTGNEELDISSLMSFELKDTSGEKGEYALLTKSIKSQLDGSIMSGDLLKGQIAYDVSEDEQYYFYYLNDLFGDKIKFVINKSDIS